MKFKVKRILAVATFMGVSPFLLAPLSSNKISRDLATVESIRDRLRGDEVDLELFSQLTTDISNHRERVVAMGTIRQETLNALDRPEIDIDEKTSELESVQKEIYREYQSLLKKLKREKGIIVSRFEKIKNDLESSHHQNNAKEEELAQLRELVAGIGELEKTLEEVESLLIAHVEGVIQINDKLDVLDPDFLKSRLAIISIREDIASDRHQRVVACLQDRATNLEAEIESLVSDKSDIAARLAEIEEKLAAVDNDETEESEEEEEENEEDEETEVAYEIPKHFYELLSHPVLAEVMRTQLMESYAMGENFGRQFIVPTYSPFPQPDYELERRMLDYRLNGLSRLSYEVTRFNDPNLFGFNSMSTRSQIQPQQSYFTGSLTPEIAFGNRGTAFDWTQNFSLAQNSFAGSRNPATNSQWNFGRSVIESPTFIQLN